MPIFAPQIAEVAQLVADPGRARMLSLLMDGREKTASELATVAGITPQTASAHLSKLLHGGLLMVEKRGPRRLYTLAGPLVAYMLEGIMTFAVRGPRRFRPPSKLDEEMRLASICYDHLTGRLGVAITEALVKRRRLVIDQDAGELTPSGVDFLREIGVDLQVAGAADVLPPLPRLERAAPAPGGTCRRSCRRPCAATRVASPPTGRAVSDHHG